MLLAGDIGGTKTNLAIFSFNRGPRAPVAEATFPSAEHPSLDALVKEFLAQFNGTIDRASFGVAGPVIDGRAEITNLPWTMDEAQLQKQLGLSSVRLLNDLAAIAHAVPFLEADDVHTLNEAEADPHGAIAIVAPGTGLGEAYLTWAGSRYRAHASEGGHADFAPAASFQLEMLRFLQNRFGHVSYERICSGRGLPNIYDFLKETGRAEEPAWLAEQLTAADDPTPVIANAALERENPPEICTRTMNVFVSILGAEAGNLALKVLATGGVYLSGGIPPRILSALDEGPFMEAFRRKGRFSHMMAKLPVHVILNPKVALLGAACHGLEPPHD